MFSFDKKITLDYIKSLEELTTYLLRKRNFGASLGSSFLIAISDVNDKCKKYIKVSKKNSDACVRISINPITFRYKNPALHNKPFFVSLGGYINIANGILEDQSFCLIITYKNEESSISSNQASRWQCQEYPIGHHVLRKFHFDVDLTLTDKFRCKSHLQYGGKFISDHWQISDEVPSYSLFSPLDHPRIPSQPQDFVMLLDFMHREFNLDGQALILESGWKRRLIEIENIWLKPYYERLLGFLNQKRDEPIYILNNR